MKKKKFLIKFVVDTGLSTLYYHFFADYKDEETAISENEVEHDECGLDTENSPIGGATGQYSTELFSVKEVSDEDYKVLRKYI